MGILELPYVFQSIDHMKAVTRGDCGHSNGRRLSGRHGVSKFWATLAAHSET